MGDVLPPKRQTVVERLKRRFDLYRRHQNGCLPRYEQAENGIYEAQRQETLLLKQRYLESKAKKAKSNKSDHHRSYKESVTDATKAQVHNKPLKRPAEEPLPNPSADCPNSEDNEKPSKLLRTDITSDKLSDIKTHQQQQQSLPSFSVQIVQQFTKTGHTQSPQTIQTNVTVQTVNKPLTSPASHSHSNSAPLDQVVSAPESHQNNVQQPSANIECKQEKDCEQTDLCQFKSAQNTTSDRLSDTFPSLGFTDDSTDDVIHPDLLKDLIDDVFTNPSDIMKDFNFDDSVESMKDQDDSTKDIISDLIKESSPMPIRPFQTDNLSFVNKSANQQQQQQPQQQSNGLFKNISSNNEVPISVMVTSTSSPTTSAPTFYNPSAQRLPSYGSSSMNIPNGLGLDFKMTEPSPAALTLKQMAEQHQNMQQKQQQQLVNSGLANRSFNQDAFSPHMNHLRSSGNYLPGSNPALQSPKTPNSNNMFNAFDRQLSNLNSFPNNEPLNNMPVSPNTIFDADIHSRTSNVLPDLDHSKQQQNCISVQQQQHAHQQQQHVHQQQQRAQHQQQQQQQQQQKPPSYSSVRPMGHFPDNSQMRFQNPVSNQQRPIGRQYQNNIQLAQNSQMHPNQGLHSVQQLQQGSHDMNQQHHIMQHSNQYANFSSQQSINNPTFHVSMSQNISYSSPYNSQNQTINNLHQDNRPPPEYKVHQSVENVNLIDPLKMSSSQSMYSHTAHKDNLSAKHQRPPNVTITPDGSVIRASSSMDWRHMISNQQNRVNSNFQNTFNPGNNNFVRNDHPIQQPQMYNQYRMPNNPVMANRMVRPNMVPNTLHVQQRQRASAPQRARNPSILEQPSHLGIGNNNLVSAMSPNFNSRQEINRNDNGILNLDFLDNIASSASDLLNFDQVMQGGTAHFPLLDDMEILGK